MKTKLKSLQTQLLNLKQVALVLLIIPFVAAAARSAQISGTAYEGDSNNGEAGVRVTLRKFGRADQNPPQFTGHDGKYSFKNLTSGKYRIEFEKIGYKMVVPYVDPIELGRNSSDHELIRAYSRASSATNIEADRIAAFLQTRSHGDVKRVTADIQTLQQSAVFDNRTILRIALASIEITKRTATIASAEERDLFSNGLSRRKAAMSITIDFVADLRALDRGPGTAEQKRAAYTAIMNRTKSPSLQPNPSDINDYYQNAATPDETAAMRAELKTQLNRLKGATTASGEERDRLNAELRRRKAETATTVDFIADLTAIHRGPGTVEQKNAIYAAIVHRTKSTSLQPNPSDIDDYYQNVATPDETAAMRDELKTQLKLLKGP